MNQDTHGQGSTEPRVSTSSCKKQVLLNSSMWQVYDRLSQPTLWLQASTTQQPPTVAYSKDDSRDSHGIDNGADTENKGTSDIATILPSTRIRTKVTLTRTRTRLLQHRQPAGITVRRIIYRSWDRDSVFFRDLILMEVSELNAIQVVWFIIRSVRRQFCSR